MVKNLRVTMPAGIYERPAGRFFCHGAPRREKYMKKHHAIWRV
jgi:hypothetical protein